MLYAIVDCLMQLFCREKHEIARKGLSRYLTRWTLWGRRFAEKPRHNVFLHCFHRGVVVWPFRQQGIVFVRPMLSLYVRFDLVGGNTDDLCSNERGSRPGRTVAGGRGTVSVPLA